MSADLIRRIGIVLAAILVYRIGDSLLLPGLTVEAWMWTFAPVYEFVFD
jgi:hypothetical protein